MRRMKDKIEGSITNADYANSAGSVAWGNVSGKPSTFTPASHTHDDRYYTKTEVNTKLDGKSNTGHIHDDRYYTESEVNTKLANYQPKGNYAAAEHTHNYAGSGTAGGSANSAVKLDSSAGSATQPVYFKDGKPVATTYALNKTVPADAKFTDTDTWRGIQNNLTSDSTDQSLSAAQGKILNDKISSLANKLNCTLTVHTNNANSTITVTLGSISYSGTADSSGACTLTLPQLGTWTVKATKNGLTATDTIVVNSYGTAYAISLYMANTTLNENPWALIKQISNNGTASNFWKVGDAKTITINGTIADASFNNLSINVFIAEFNHNASFEGGNRIHFLLGKSTSDISKMVGLTASYNLTNSGFVMNTSSTSYGGWSDSYMRKKILDQNASEPSSNSLMAALPSDLRSVLKIVDKYSNNGTGSSPNISQSSDYLFLLSEYEINGTVYSCANSEKNYQTQYDYFKAGNSKICYRFDDQSSVGAWWTRSPGSNTSSRFVYMAANGNGTSSDNANISHALIVGFCV